MENKSYIAAIDLGSGSVTVAAASKDPDGRLNIIDIVSKPMQGMSCGEVINIEQVTGAVRSAVNELEANLGIKITEAYAGISGHDIKCADSSYFVYVSGQDHEICEEDVAKLHESMTNLQPPEGICILDRIPQKYVIDSREETMQPVGRFGQQLEATFNFILGNRSSLERLNKAFMRLGIDQTRLFTNAQASAAAVLTDDERELGAAVVDIGAGCTDICIWQDNIMRYVGILPIGSDAINRDIRSIAIPDRFIEKLKTTHGYAVANRIPEEKKAQSIKIKGRTPRENKEISFYNLAQIIEARMLDIVENVMEEINESGYGDKLGSGIVLTGGGALLRDIDALFRERTKYDVRIGCAYPEVINDASSAPAEDPHLTSVIGLLLLGMQDSEIEATDAPLFRKDADGEAGIIGTHTASAESPEETSTNPSSDLGGEHLGAGDGSKQKDAGEKTAADVESASVKTGAGKPDKGIRSAKGRKKGFLGGLKSIFTDIFEVVDDDEI